jgi:hypothetical protein
VELKRATSDVRSTVQEEMHKIEEEIELKEVRESAQDFKNELGGVANKIDPLTLSKITSEDEKDDIYNSSDVPEEDKNQSEQLAKDDTDSSTENSVETDETTSFAKYSGSFTNPRAEKS